MQSITKTEISNEFPELFDVVSGFELEFDSEEKLISAVWRDPLFVNYKDKLPVKLFEQVSLKITNTGGDFMSATYDEKTQTETRTGTDKEGVLSTNTKNLPKAKWIRESLFSVKSIANWQLACRDERRKFYDDLSAIYLKSNQNSFQQKFKNFLKFFLRNS